MKFNKPLNRDVEISGNAFVVGLDQTAITFRLKGKRKVVQVDWQTVLDAARGENGERATEYLGIPKGSPQATVPQEDSPALSHSASAGEHTSES
jgi:hypothetical protein